MPVVVAAEGNESEAITPHAQIQILEILQAHGQLSCNTWAKHCKEAHQVAESTFYTHRKILSEQGMIEVSGEKVKGKAVYYAVTERGLELLG